MNPHIEAFLRDVENHKDDGAAVYNLIDIYYQQVAYAPPKSDNDMVALPFSEELKLPVEYRASGIMDALMQLFDSGHDANESDGVFNAMMLAVGEGDAPMVRFLIEHGADVNTWSDMDEMPEFIQQNYYLEDIDIHYMNECFDNDKDIEYMKALRQTALVLAEFGHLRSYTGHCLNIDANGNVTLESPQFLY